VIGQESNSRSNIIAAMPAFNEESYIGTVVLKTRQYVNEVVVVDDGSTDRTADVAELAGATVVRHEHNKGYGASIQTILAEAKKRNPDILVLLDADSQHNPNEIPDIIKPIALDGFDLVIGSRKSHKGNVPAYRRIGQGVLSYLSYILSEKKLTDSECGFRAFSRKAVNTLELNQHGMSVSAETIATAADRGLKITEVPISAIYTKDSSTLNPVVHGLGNLNAIITMISQRRPLFFFSLLGFILILLGLIAGGRVLYIISIGGSVAIGTALVATLLFVIGALSIFTGMILHTLTSMVSQRRPLFFFSVLGFILILLGLIAGGRVLYINFIGGSLATGTALVAILLLFIGALSIFTGMILHTLARRKD